MSAKDREQLFQHAKGVSQASKALDAVLDERQALDAKLTEAYHVIFDIKDEAVDPIRYKAYETLCELGRLMNLLGLVVPRRQDGDGR